MKSSFQGVYRGKKVLVTGDTGFKGSWLSLWLQMLGAKVIGYSAYLPSEPCHFQSAGLGKIVAHYEGDVRDYEKLREVFQRTSPEIVFHLAAQPLVRESYRDPKRTFDTNVGGIVNLLECLRIVKSVRAAVIVTSDKCYRNKEWAWGYRENDELGGDDPYSASKGAAELVCRAYAVSFFQKGEGIRVATARAGNVIGGGDWAADRIVPDCVRAWSSGGAALVRSPHATRPWQHVLEPLSGYLWLGAQLFATGEFHGEAFNFGPSFEVSQTVQELIEHFTAFFGEAKWQGAQRKEVKESTLLKLSCDKALQLLNWRAVLTFEETVRLTAEWYKKYYEGKSSMLSFSKSQIVRYTSLAKKRGLPWA